MAKKNSKKKGTSSNQIAYNKRAKFEYKIEENFEAGLALQGWEVKAIRVGKVNLSESYVFIRGGEAWLFGCTINPLNTASTHVVADPLRSRKLLLKRREIDRLEGLIERQGYTLIPISMYWKKSFVKIDVGLGKGKQAHDKRADIKDREWQVEKGRLMKHSVR
ncbi:SsrA-binding protein SmpB [Paraferrimonas sp. SM1919]|uniref:SsrA-binding protein SmpB n=1 Tax=Paraferrimonas sp. SM1919 TaxID=2662263 RepID=UPI0013CF4195|nr:SsrA-binding protein SmpB [Paraferrimonas sp. SM1919]